MHASHTQMFELDPREQLAHYGFPGHLDQFGIPLGAGMGKVSPERGECMGTVWTTRAREKGSRRRQQKH